MLLQHQQPVEALCPNSTHEPLRDAVCLRRSKRRPRCGHSYGVQSETSPIRTVQRYCRRGSHSMFKLIATMRRGSSSNLATAWARYPTIDAARLGTVTLLRDDRILRVMIVRNEIPPAFVEWAER
jgi:hypothetical protein